jgi:hypothetical protein
VVESGDLGTYDELVERNDEFKPHVVHLSGHAQAGEHGAVFLFEDERGQGDPRSAADLRQAFAGGGVECVFLSGCEAGKAPSRAALGGLGSRSAQPAIAPLALAPASPLRLTVRPKSPVAPRQQFSLWQFALVSPLYPIGAERPGEVGNALK